VKHDTTWDSAKAERNERVRGVSFEQAKEIFVDRSIPARKAERYERTIYEEQLR
jgi:uncharacterized DUF497 family protein